MTRDEILNMPAGREMDILIAEHVFGMRLEKNYGFAGGFFWVGNGVSFGEVPACNVTEYSTDIAAAWEVVEKLHELGWALTLDDMRHDKDNSGWWYELSRFEGAKLGDIEHEFPTHYHTLDGMGDTAQLAICRAALLAVATKTQTL